jgi:hypothetical protein
MVAAFQRTLLHGRQYDKYFPISQLKHNDRIILEDSDTFDTIEQMAKLAYHYQGDTAGVASVLKVKNLEDTLRRDWEFAYNHFQYTPDKKGVEQLRRPLRAWADRVAGIDCDCYSILLSTILLNQGIPHKLRKTKYNGGDDYQHIYVVVDKPGGSGYWTLDPVTDKFNKEEPFTGHFDKPMASLQVLDGIPLQVLDGAPAPDAPLVAKGFYQAFGFGAEFLGIEAESNQVHQDVLDTIRTTALSGLGRLAGTDVMGTPEQIAELARATDQTHDEAVADSIAIAHASASFVERLRQHLLNVAEQIDSYSRKEPHLVVLRGRIALILAHWDNEPERTRLFEVLGEQEEAEAQQANLAGLGSWIGDAWDGVKSAASAVGNAVSSAASGVAQAATWTYGTVLKPVGQAIGQAASWVADKVVAAVKAAAQGIKKAAIWIAEEAVKLGKLILKYNPLSILIRAGLRLTFRVNLFYLSGRLGHGYFSEAQAQAFGMDMDEWRKCKGQLGKVISMWEGLQGDVEVLQESILLGYTSGKQPKIADKPDQGLNGLACLPTAERASLHGLGEPATATATVAASGFIATIVTWLSKVDWDKLIKVAKTVVDKVFVKKQYDSVPVITANTLLPTSEADYKANQAKYETQTDQSSSLALPLGIGAAVAMYLYSTSSSKKSS